MNTEHPECEMMVMTLSSESRFVTCDRPMGHSGAHTSGEHGDVNHVAWTNHGSSTGRNTK